MSRLFFDTSALAKRYTEEAGTEVVDELIESDETAVIITSLSIVEMASAFRRKQNRGDLSKSDVDDLLTAFFRESLEQFTIVPLNETRFERAPDLVLRDDLRTLDNLQLTAALDVAADLELTFVCADRKLVSVAANNGLESINPTESNPLDSYVSDGA